MDTRHSRGGRKPLTTEPRRALGTGIRAALAALLAVPALLVAVPPAAAASSNTLTVKAGEYTYKLSGSPKAGWTQVTFDNVGVEYHMMAVFPLKKGVTKKQLQAAA